MNNDGPETFEQLIVSLSKTPKEIRKLVSDFSSGALAVRPSPEEFSPREQVCHLRDIEVEGYSVRIQRILSEEQPSLPDIDGARLAMERDYNRQNLSDALAAFTQARNHNVALLSELDDEQLKRTGTLVGVGEINLTGLLQMMWEHDEGHLEELQVISKRLGIDR